MLLTNGGNELGAPTPSTRSPDPLNATFAALADPTRRAILARLSQGEATVNELAAPFKMSLSAISKHIKVLERARLITRERKAQWRPCRLEPHTLKAVSDWVEYYHRLWDDSLDNLDDYLQTFQAQDHMKKEQNGETP
jgi:DNA-binding transcriptional ArsR family regulator